MRRSGQAVELLWNHLTNCKHYTNAISYSLLPKEATGDESPEEQSYAPNCGDNVFQNNIMTSESESREKSDNHLKTTVA